MRDSEWLRLFRKQLARLLRDHPDREIFKEDSVTLALQELDSEQRQLSLCWRLPRKPP